MADKLLKSGDLAYLDVIGTPLVPCRVESVKGRAGAPGTGQEITVKLTADRGAYKRGEVLTFSGSSVVPRSSVFVRNGQYRILNDWEVQPD
ncbi:hypothetical protein E1091_03465 [Micromonospora fluostatini]|uniref:Uncharacterized protein n=1 Tax=Micromonospora fluostatini TaxID=1629071 RepID=A0ABY2DKF6_9ACTN|nr:hypothetical protein E1091_03465 [Micromonospora fluostatini]